MKTKKKSLKSVKKVNNASKEYDITTEKTHNFFADGILFHNCAGLYYFEDEWVMHTLGTVEGEGPVHTDDILSVPFDGTFSDLFFYAWDKVYGEDKLETLNKNYNYVFELMTPYNIVVKEHKDYKISLLAVRDLNTLNEIPVENFEDEFHTPSVFDFKNLSPENLKESLEEFPPDEEGYVVRDDNFNRIKLKNPGYVARHRMKDSAVNKKNGVLELVLNEQDDDFVSTFPDLKEQVEKIKDDLRDLIDHLNKTFSNLEGPSVDPDDHEERKRFALDVKEKVPASLQGYMFAKLTDDKSFEEIIKGSQVSNVATALNNFNDR